MVVSAEEMAAMAAEYEKLTGELGALRAVVDRFEDADGIGPALINKCYPVTFNLPAVPDNSNFPFQTNSFVVDEGTIFRVKSIEAVYSILGTLVGTTQAATLTMPPTIRPSLFDFVWKVRDSGSDREWSNAFLPSSLLLSGNINGFRFRRAHCTLSGGAEVTVSLDAQFFANTVNTGLDNINGHKLQFTFTGVEVKA